VPDQNVEALATTIEYALDNPEECKEKAYKARIKVSSYDVALIVERYEALLRATLAERSLRFSRH
jgi:glycosyltransferase involved in cell wall biosynthesis